MRLPRLLSAASSREVSNIASLNEASRNTTRSVGESPRNNAADTSDAHAKENSKTPKENAEAFGASSRSAREQLVAFMQHFEGFVGASSFALVRMHELGESPIVFSNVLFRQSLARQRRRQTQRRRRILLVANHPVRRILQAQSNEQIR